MKIDPDIRLDDKEFLNTLKQEGLKRPDKRRVLKGSSLNLSFVWI